MSTDWNIHCVDCNSTHMFSDANHQEDLMRVLIRHRDAIASIAPLLAESRSDIEFGTHWGSIDASWFAEHKGHKLQPINEYGRLDDQCRESVPCECGYTIPSSLLPWPSNDEGIPGDEILLAIELADVDLNNDVHDVVTWYWERGI